MKRLLIIALIMALSGCATCNWNSERRHECEVESQLQAQIYWGEGSTASAMAILNYFDCMCE